MSTPAQQIITEARSWKGTPFRHQGRLRHLGVDCVGFVSEVARGIGIQVDIPGNYAPSEDGVIMLRLLNNHMDLVAEAQPGDVLALCDPALRNPDVPRHVAFVTEVTPRTTFIIHASSHGIREHRIDASWSRRIHSIWRLRVG